MMEPDTMPNLPITETIFDCRSILMAGMGGGFDVLCGLPIFFPLKHQVKDVHLASFNFSDIANYKDGIGLGIEPDLSYYHVSEKIAALTRERGFLGSCSLTPSMKPDQFCRAALEYAQGMSQQDPSVVNSSRGQLLHCICPAWKAPTRSGKLW